MDTLIRQLVHNQRLASPDQIQQIVDHVAQAPFAWAVLEVDEPLWGSFWHADVISPGYKVPAVELALLRAVRLDGSWPEETGLEAFLSDLKQAILQPEAGLWTISLTGAPCVVIAAPARSGERPAQAVDELTSEYHSGPGRVAGKPALATVVWYCATTGRLHAGYRGQLAALDFGDAVEQRRPSLSFQTDRAPGEVADWLRSTVAQRALLPDDSFAARLDLEILRLRLAAGSTGPASPA